VARVWADDQVGLIERDLKLLKLTDEREYVQAVILSAADQSSSDASLVDSIELYHLAGSYDRVVDSVNRALGHSLAQPNGALSSISGGQSLGLSGAFGGAEDVYQLAQRVQQVYERDVARRNKVRRDAWETLEVLLKLKRGMREFMSDRPDIALEVSLPFLPSHVSQC
jgi:nuclear pore complex protein Nup93